MLKQLQADSIVFFMKTHNHHWNVKGANFPQTHAKTQEIYEEYAETFDDLAERIIQLGGVPCVTLAEALKLTKIKEESKTTFSTEEVLDEILKDYEYFERAFRELSTIAESEQDKVTSAYADDKVASLQKSIWMLKAQRG